MPKLSLWKTEKSADYRFFDRNVSEQFTVGGTDLYVHKYIGVNNPSNSVDATLPHYDKTDPTNIQDLLFLENRDRKYDTSIYRLRGHYNVQNLDFDLSQFGLFLTNDIIFVTVHYNDMIDIIGRKLMVGDVFELPHLTDYHPLNDTIPIGLRRYYQITDANYASEGFSQTWFPHIWRIKCEPLVDSQEFANILQQPINKDNYLGDWDPTKTYFIPPGETYTITFGDKIYQITGAEPNGTTVAAGVSPDLIGGPWTLSMEQNLADIIGRYNKNLEINQAVIDEAKRQVPKLGYDRSQLYVVPTFTDGEPAPPIDLIVNPGTPIWPTGNISIVNSSAYRNSSIAIRLNRQNVNNLLSIAGSNNINAVIQATSSIMLQMIEAPPEQTDSGSGRVSGDNVISLTVVGETVTGPYGTADNTYATADQYVNFTLTALETPVNVRTFGVVDLTRDIGVDLLLGGIVYSPNGTLIDIFPPNTRIVSFDKLLNTITINNSTLSAIPAGTAINVNTDFIGTVTPEMDYRADCDPRFQFIRRSSPRSFGYIAGYDSGDGTAPNGEPLGSGIVFPVNPKIGDYFLRLDYLPQKLFRWDGRLWVEISRNVRTDTGFVDSDQSQLSSFINDRGRTTTAQGTTIPTRQSLSTALRIRPD